MRVNPETKYQLYPTVDLSDRSWPTKSITSAPMWCSVDLRDGNQSLVTPMSINDRVDFFKNLVGIGFKHIEVGCPGSSEEDFEFVRVLVDKGMLPDDIRVQVMVSTDQEEIKRTFDAVEQINEPIIHLYTSISQAHRDLVYKVSKEELKNQTIAAVNHIRNYEEKKSVILEYSPESFTAAELDYALEIINSVIQAWDPSSSRKLIINLPATVELSLPNVFADRVEFISRNMSRRDQVVLSVNTHNDRGTAIAAAELALLAGAERIEGTLFGNGERSGNADIVTLALNMVTSGVDPTLNLNNISQIRTMVEKCNKMNVPERQPYAGDLVLTTYTTCHQNAIRACMEQFNSKTDNKTWDVLYLPIDPMDIGRTYEGIPRTSSHSVKGGVAHILEKECGYQLPKSMHPEFSGLLQAQSDSTGSEIDTQMIVETFKRTYFNYNDPITFISYKVRTNDEANNMEGILTIRVRGNKITLNGFGNGPIDACVHAMSSYEHFPVFFLNTYSEHSLESGSTSKAISYIQIRQDDGMQLFGVGIDTDIAIASIKAMVSAMNRLLMMHKPAVS